MKKAAEDRNVQHAAGAVKPHIGHTVELNRFAET